MQPLDGWGGGNPSREQLVQAAKAKARSYSPFRNLRTIIYLIAGKLDLTGYPPEIAQRHLRMANPTSRRATSESLETG